MCDASTAIATAISATVPCCVAAKPNCEVGTKSRSPCTKKSVQRNLAWEYEEETKEWVPFPRDVCAVLALAKAAGDHLCKLDPETFVDLTELVVRRFDDHSVVALVRQAPQ
eukprot:TRINITY_DN4847_c0_g1_i1.p3 TRINITY_DN4847_c0_g1~~TRINITY_DN4847_c0_g1_i1.p3  ORF type:complete len:111 (+),score=26.69 TRINITY_DN4847_c0_g1_i1:752-1084(+)